MSEPVEHCCCCKDGFSSVDDCVESEFEDYVPNHKTVVSTNYNYKPNVQIFNKQPHTVLQFGEGKVRQLARFFESNAFFQSTPNLCAVNKLDEDENCKVLKQLREWSTHGTSGKDYILDFKSCDLC